MVVLATWNVENLFRPGADFGPTSEAAYEAKLTGLAHVIGGMRPDVLAVQEAATRRPSRTSLSGSTATGTS